MMFHWSTGKESKNKQINNFFQKEGDKHESGCLQEKMLSHLYLRVCMSNAMK